MSDVVAVALAGAALCGAPPPAREEHRQVIVTSPHGFAWREALVGVAAAGTAIAIVAGAGELRHRSSPPKERP